MTGAADFEDRSPSGDGRAGRGWRTGVLLLLLLALVVVGVVVALSLIRDRGEPNVTEETLNTAEVRRVDLADETIYEATLGRPVARYFTAGSSGTVTWVPEPGTLVEAGDNLFSIDDTPVVLLDGEVPAYRDLQLGDTEITFAAGANGVVTRLPDAGTILESGSAIARIDEVSLVVLEGDIPMYRTLRVDVEGPDVEQLEQSLVDLGYDPDGEVTIDEEFTRATGDLVERWQEDLGVDETGQVHVGELLFAPVPAQVLSIRAIVGTSVSPVTPILEVSGGSLLSGLDVLQLERALSVLGYDAGSVDGVYDINTARAVIEWTEAVGHGQDGRIPVGSIVFHPGSLRTTDVLASVGSAVGPSSPVLSASALAKIVRLDLPAEDQGVLSAGSQVIIVMPDRSETSGIVTFVSTVASGGGQGNPSVFEVEITLDIPEVADGLDEAPVDVKAVSEVVENVLAVPVSALMALAEGGYAVEVVEGNGVRLVAVEPGFFADGLVEIAGDIAAGDLVVTP